MYRATTSFTTKDYDIKYKEILADDFTTQEEINEFLDIGYIEVYDDTLDITENGIYDVNDYKKVDVNVSGGSSNVLVVPNGMKFAYSTITSFGDLQLDTSSVTTMARMFNYCTNLTSIPLLDTSSVNEMYDMFAKCTNLTSIPLLDTSSVNSMTRMFDSCTNLTSIPLLDTSSVNDMGNMFSNCTNLTSIPLLDMSSTTYMAYMLSNCTNLTSIPLLDTSSVTNASYAFNNCTSLTTIPVLNTKKIQFWTNIFYNCNNLSNESLNNILKMCINATSYIGTKTLKQIGLSSSQATTCQSLSNWNDFVTAGWSTGY